MNSVTEINEVRKTRALNNDDLSYEEACKQIVEILKVQAAELESLQEMYSNAANDCDGDYFLSKIKELLD